MSHKMIDKIGSLQVVDFKMFKPVFTEFFKDGGLSPIGPLQPSYLGIAVRQTGGKWDLETVLVNKY